MAKTVIGLFDTRQAAESAVQDLRDNGVDSSAISVVANNANGGTVSTTDGDTTEDNAAEGAGTGAVGGTVLGGALGLLVGAGLLAIPGIGPVLAAGPLAAAIGTTAAAVGAGALGAGIGAATGGLLGGLVGAGVPEADAHVYAEGVRRGGTLVSVDADDTQADLVADILQRHAPVDVDTRGSQLRESGWDRFNPEAGRYSDDTGSSVTSTTPPATVAPTTTSAATTSTSANTDAERVLPVVEEQIEVGKREVQRGGVRVHTRVVETPVEEQVRLREEHVEVERRPVDRPVTDADQALLRDQVIEVRETAEEAVVSKEARVVEEVVVDKEVTEHTETVRDTVRRTDVSVDQLGGTTGTSGYDAYDADFRSHYQTTYGSGGQPYTQYEPSYRYGYGLDSNSRYQNREWADIEADVRQDWERQHSDSPWEKAKDSVRYAWEKARGRR